MTKSEDLQPAVTRRLMPTIWEVVMTTAVAFTAAMVFRLTQMVDKRQATPPRHPPNACLTTDEYNHVIDDAHGWRSRSAEIALRLYNVCIETQLRDIREGRPLMHTSEPIQ